jgi:hypothetical protein
VIFADPRTSTALSSQLHRLGQFVAATFAYEVGYSSISLSPFLILRHRSADFSLVWTCHLMLDHAKQVERDHCPARNVSQADISPAESPF